MTDASNFPHLATMHYGTLVDGLVAALKRAVDAGIGSDGRRPSPADEARDAIAKAAIHTGGAALPPTPVAEVRAAMVLGNETTMICPLVDGGTLPAGTKLYAHPVGAGAIPTPQQVSDYLNSLDCIQRDRVEREARAKGVPAARGAWKPKPLEDVRNCLDKSLKRAAELLRTTGHAGDAIDAQRIEYQRELNASGVMEVPQ